MEVKKLAMTILSQMAKALNMESEEMRALFSEGVQSMRMNYYPPCLEPDRAMGFTPHSDADAFTILYDGLQIRKNGKWVPVAPLHNAFVVNIGDIMEGDINRIVRRPKVKENKHCEQWSVSEHRATVNSTKERLSIATFYNSDLDSELGPARSLVGPNKPPIFRRLPIEKYFKEFFSRKLNGKSYLDFMKIQSNGEAK
ncbi:2-oxoglutarate (2OG) and Fe(II)-dependent oxygenase superfamily protein [Actinidia rufa]|uniref:2-oxoglutarate (2OG) and Fe(II)-dependent oxygenase superfamily protein n=1 Tax=Actinidia rufa TaxID=165716 RepID=A0A7J0ERF3_9ERIC|nr:2-oxoglutarate (2OG) and Fe(II)-dependent oxygenase superfamily protein [Actinidia rufa]